MDNTSIVVLESGSQHEDLKFEADLTKAVGLAFASPFGAIVVELILRGIAINWYLPLKLFLALSSLLISCLLLSYSRSIMRDRQWRIERENKRVNTWMHKH